MDAFKIASISRFSCLYLRPLTHPRKASNTFRNVRSMMTQTSSSTSAPSPTAPGKREGTIADAFASLSGQTFGPLDPRFAAIKASLIQGHSDAVVASWHRLLDELRVETARVAALGSSIVPTIDFSAIDSPPADFASEFRRRGVAVIRGVIPKDEALQLKADVRSYLSLNPQTKAFPSTGDVLPAVYELYWSSAQIRARGDPRMLAAQSFALSHWHSEDAAAPVSLRHPIAYADRLRMRQPGDSAFALGPHVDGGSVERWEPVGYGRGNVYEAVFQGRWEELDQWEASRRLPVVADLYGGVGACSAFRMCQGWLSISDVGPFEGTLLVNPMLKLATAYYLLRPFFTPRLPPPVDNGDAPAGTGTATDTAYTAEFLSPDNWTLETSPASSWLHGATPGHGQELRAHLHPHLDLNRTMVHVPRVSPGDYVLWHCDTIHAVDSVHKGTSDSSVMYIPACPLTLNNAEYLVRQRECFLKGSPSPDFGGGIGESAHVGRPGAGEVQSVGGQEALRSMGLAAWAVDVDMDGDGDGEKSQGQKETDGKMDLTEGEKTVMREANRILGF